MAMLISLNLCFQQEIPAESPNQFFPKNILIAIKEASIPAQSKPFSTRSSKPKIIHPQTSKLFLRTRMTFSKTRTYSTSSQDSRIHSSTLVLMKPFYLTFKKSLSLIRQKTYMGPLNFKINFYRSLWSCWLRI